MISNTPMAKLRAEMLAAGGHAEGSPESAAAAMAAEIQREVLHRPDQPGYEHHVLPNDLGVVCQPGPFSLEIDYVRQFLETQ